MHHGEHYDIPHGEHRPLKLMARPLRADIPIYLAAIGPRNVALAVEIADGWLPIWISPERLHERLGRHARCRAAGFDVAAFSVPVALDDDIQAARDAVRPALALYVGGMGDVLQRARRPLRLRSARPRRIKELYLGGKKLEAIAAVPDALVDEVALVGPRERDRRPARRMARLGRHDAC